MRGSLWLTPIAFMFQNADKLLLEAERDTTVQLRLEIQGWETDVKRLETELNLQKVYD